MEKWLLVITLSLPAVFGGAIPGQEKCAYGPPYWCSHIAHARECGARQHCLQTVWKMQVIQPQSTATCTYCELIVNEIRDVLRDKATEEKVASLLTNVCAVLPSADTRDMCKDIVQEYTPELIQMFENDINTDMICAALQLCSGLEDDVSPYGVKAANTSECQDCEKFFQDVQASITSKETLNQLIQLLNQTVCSQLGPLSQTCVDLLNQYLPVFLQFLADQIDPNITCRVFGFCTSEEAHLDVIPFKNVFKSRKTEDPLLYRSSEECEICKDFLNQIVETIRDKTVQDKVTYELKNVVCVQLGSFADQCKELVDEYAPMLFELLVNELDPTTVCEAVGLCQVPSSVRSMPVAAAEPASMVGSGYVKESTECTLCKFFMTEVDNLLKANGTVKFVEDFLDKICAKLPTPDLTSQCEAFVKEYGELVIDLLAQELDPNVICSNIGLCSTNAEALKQLLKAGDNGTCQLCILLVGQIEKAVANMSEEDLLNDLKSFCSVIPEAYSATCLKYVNDYGSLLISLLKSGEDPKSLCQLADMCAGTKRPYRTKPIPEDLPKAKAPSEECKICNTVVIVAKSFLQNNASKEEIKQALESVCGYLPQEIASLCEGFVAQYGDNLVDFLARELDASTICRELGLCEAVKQTSLTVKQTVKQTSLTVKQTVPVSAVSVIMSPYDTLPLVPLVQSQENKKESAPSIECEVCDTVIIYLKSILSDNASRAEIEVALKSLCSDVPSMFEDACKTLVDTYADQIVELLLKKLDAHAICIELKLCNASDDKELKISEVLSPYDTLPIVEPKAQQKESSKTGGEAECELCKIMMNYLDKELQDNRTEENIKAALEKLCTALPDTLQAKCQNLVDKYSLSIINYVILSMSPDEICQKLGLCTAAVKKLPEPVHVTLLKDDSGLKTAVSAKPECILCEFVMKELNRTLNGNRSQAEVKKALEMVCSFFPDTVRDECEVFVDQYSSLIIKLLVDTVTDPSAVCSKLRLCTAEALKAEANPACVICEFVMREVDIILSGNKSEAAVVSALDKVCSFFPDTVRSECVSFVNTYGKLIINLIVKSLADPSTVCTDLGLCTSTKKADTVHQKVTKVDASPECVLCEFVMKELDNILGNNRSEAAIKNALDQVCSLFPDSIRSECVVFVNKYSDYIVQLLVQEMDPQAICTALGLCSGQGVSSWGTFVKILPEKSKVGVDVCPVCKFVVEQLQNFLKENHTTEEVEQFLKALCDKLPDTVTAQCHDVVDEYVPAILDLIDENLKPEEICQQIGLCNQTSSAVQQKTDSMLKFKPNRLVGQNKCTYGPAYWCASKDNAKECNAVEHCMRHVWN